MDTVCIRKEERGGKLEEGGQGYHLARHLPEALGSPLGIPPPLLPAASATTPSTAAPAASTSSAAASTSSAAAAAASTSSAAAAAASAAALVVGAVRHGARMPKSDP